MFVLDLSLFCYSTELEQLLSMEISCAMECARGAVRMNNQALEACKLHTRELRKAMEAENEDVSRCCDANL